MFSNRKLNLNMSRVDLNGSLKINNILQICMLQNRLYTKSIWGCYNSFGVKVSKLILSLQLLFPVNVEDLSLEFITIGVLDFSLVASEFIFKFKVVHYFEFNDIIYID